MNPYAQSSLGGCLAAIIRDREHILLALAPFFDGSGNPRDGSTHWITLAGIAADDSAWVEFDGAWNAILADRNPKPKYSHMREAMKQYGEFDQTKGWKPHNVAALVKDLLFYLQTLDKERFRFFACSIDMAAYRRLQAEGLSLEDPIVICNRYCAERALYWYATAYPGIIVNKANFFFDQNEDFEEGFKQHWTRKKNQLVIGSAFDEFWKLIETVSAADMRDKPPLQAADMLAWACNREQTGQGKEYEHLAHVIKNISTTDWIRFDKERLQGGTLHD